MWLALAADCGGLVVSTTDQGEPMSDQIKYLLSEDQMPKAWYNPASRSAGAAAASAAPRHAAADRP
jgi:hypothetical protein